ncbi:hypothetical protein ABE494_02375 [Stenotrophomonas lactitubi]|uniref:hypothetical protein n=1 Tax=Stenotrophomonas lactitubi TaxID=2045214 RepID=UPI00320919C3
MAEQTITVEHPFSLVPIQDSAPMFKVCAGIDIAHTDLKASIYFDFVQRYLEKLDSDSVTDDDMFVLADILEISKSLRRAGGVW